MQISGKYVVSLILLLAASSVMLVFTEEIFSQGTDAAAEVACRNSVLLRGAATAEINIFGPIDASVEKATPLACETQEVGVLTEEPRVVYEELAQRSSRCWWMFAEGEIDDLFKEDAGEQACHVCYTFSVENQNIDPVNFTEYLNTNEVDIGAIRGGGTQMFIGDGIQLRSEVNTDQSSIDIEDVGTTQASGRGVLSLNSVLSESQENTITTALDDIAVANQINGYVIVADTIENLNRANAQDALRRIALDDEDAQKRFLLGMSTSTRQLRLDLGSDLQVHVNEYEIAALLQEAQNARNADDLGRSLVRIVETLKEEMTTEEETAIQPGTYYSYLSKGGETFPIISEFDTERTYAIAYLSPSNEVSYSDFFSFYGTTAGGGAGGAAAIGTGAGIAALGFSNPIGLTAVGVSAGAGALIGYNIMEELLPDENPSNHITVLPYQVLQEQCNVQ